MQGDAHPLHLSAPWAAKFLLLSLNLPEEQRCFIFLGLSSNLFLVNQGTVLQDRSAAHLLPGELRSCHSK